MEEHFKVLWSLSEEIAKEYIRVNPFHQSISEKGTYGVQVYREKLGEAMAVYYTKEYLGIEIRLYSGKFETDRSITIDDIKYFIKIGEDFLRELKSTKSGEIFFKKRAEGRLEELRSEQIRIEKLLKRM